MSEQMSIYETSQQINNQVSFETGNIVKMLAKKDSTIENLLNDIIKYREELNKKDKEIAELKSKKNEK